MTHAPDPRTAAGSPADADSWWWRWEDEDSREITQDPRQEFPSRADAESWLGEAFEDLAEQGVAAVTLFEGERQVYGPMSLSEA